MRFRSTNPKYLESALLSRLSPIMKYFPLGITIGPNDHIARRWGRNRTGCCVPVRSSVKSYEVGCILLGVPLICSYFIFFHWGWVGRFSFRLYPLECRLFFLSIGYHPLVKEKPQFHLFAVHSILQDAISCMALSNHTPICSQTLYPLQLLSVS